MLILEKNRELLSGCNENLQTKVSANHSCQHHIFDKILCLVMDEEFGGNARSPNVEYPLVSKLMKNYEELKTSFKNGTEQIHNKSGWRDYMEFLYHLTRVFTFLMKRIFSTN